MPNINKKVFTIIVFLIGILLLLLYLTSSNFLQPGEQHFQGGGFKQTESSAVLKAGIMESKETVESNGETNDKTETNEEVKKEKVPPPNYIGN